MTASLTIEYKDPERPSFYHPFSFQSILTKHWWPLAERNGLETLQRIEMLIIEERAEAEQLVRELEIVEGLLRSPDRDGVPEDAAQYMLERLTQLLPPLKRAVAEWEAVKELSL